MRRTPARDCRRPPGCRSHGRPRRAEGGRASACTSSLASHGRGLSRSWPGRWSARRPFPRSRETSPNLYSRLPDRVSNQPPSWNVRPWVNTTRPISTGSSSATANQSSRAGWPSKVTTKLPGSSSLMDPPRCRAGSGSRRRRRATSRKGRPRSPGLGARRDTARRRHRRRRT